MGTASTMNPTAQSNHPTNDPTNNPLTSYPTNTPSDNPLPYPSMHPIMSPTKSPSELPTPSPTFFPTIYPTIYPSMEPTNEPTVVSVTKDPSNVPSYVPTGSPTDIPSISGCLCIALNDPYCCDETLFANGCEAECEGYDLVQDCDVGKCVNSSKGNKMNVAFVYALFTVSLYLNFPFVDLLFVFINY